MIFLCSTAENRMPADRLLGSLVQSGSLFWRILPVTYEALVRRGPPRHPEGTWIFLDAEILQPEMAARVADIHALLAARGPGVRLLNHPLRSCGRLELLRRLHAAGINRFRAFPADAPLPEDLRFPVFLRNGRDHMGSRTPLLADRTALAAALESAQAVGSGLAGWIVTEFEDCRESDGLYRKYAAMRVGDLILPRSLFFSAEWMLKMPDRLDPELLAQELDYLARNPHAETLRRVFDLAGIEFGRVDYAVADGALQIWEINTNPVTLRINHTWGGARGRTHHEFRDRLQAALEAIALPSPHPPLASKAADLRNQLHRLHLDLLRPALRPWLRQAAAARNALLGRRAPAACTSL